MQTGRSELWRSNLGKGRVNRIWFSGMLEMTLRQLESFGSYTRSGREKKSETGKRGET